MIDDSVLSLVKDELDSGESPESIIEKLRKLDYSDEEIESIFDKLMPGRVTVIERPSRTTVLKTVFSLKVLGVIGLIIILVVGLYSLALFFGITETSEQRAKRIADSTAEAQLFLKSTALQNSVISCIPKIDPDNAELALCTVISNYNVQSLGSGKYRITYGADENPLCPKNYIKENNLLVVEIDLVSSHSTSSWLGNSTFDQPTVNLLYPQKDNCSLLSGYVNEFVSEINES